MSSVGDSLESVERRLAFSSLILLPYSTRAATMEASSWELSDSSRVRGLFVDNTGSSSRMSWKGSRSGRMASGLDDEDRPGFALTIIRGGFCRLP